MRASISFPIDNPQNFKVQLVRYCETISTCVILDSNNWTGNKNELIAGVGMLGEIAPLENSFTALQHFHDTHQDWIFGYLSYDLKNETENLSSKHFDGIGFSSMHFFQPEFVLLLNEQTLEIKFLPTITTAIRVNELFQNIRHSNIDPPYSVPSTSLKTRISMVEYLEAVEKIKNHIRIGDVYELNYCMEFFAEHANINPAEVFLALGEVLQSPFSAFLKLDEKYLMCGSPERFMKKTGNKIISQPIKGTARRGKSTEEDLQIIQKLSLSEKEKSENVMIVDLVRNDLSKTCTQVSVENLFGIFTFKQWHQMISTVSGNLRVGVSISEVLKQSFPMGSMTGAPKVRAMQIIEELEKTKRGLYSGAVGYITPESDFDFNVVIRSILYNRDSQYLSLQAGSAITAKSDAAYEYEECILKAKGLFEALNAKTISSKNSESNYVTTVS